MASRMKVLHIDDDRSFSHDLHNIGLKHGIDLIYSPTLDAGFADLCDSAKYRAVILDGQGQISEDGAIGYAFVTKAIQKMEELRHLKGRAIPYLFLTAYRPRLDEIVPQETLVIGKEEETDVFFKKLISLIDKSEEAGARKEHEKVFEIFVREHLSDKVEEDLLRILMQYKDFSKRKETLSSCRTVGEAVFRKLAEKKILFTEEFINSLNGRYDFWEYYNFLDGKKDGSKKWTSLAGSSAINTHKIPSAYGSHHPDDDAEITKYTAGTVVYSLLDFLLWFKDVMDRHGGDKIA